MDTIQTLVHRAQDHDLEAYSELVRRFQDMAVGYAYSILGDFDSAEDAAQEAFIQAYRDLPSLREPAAFPGWFRRIVFKHCHRLIRKKRVPTVPLEEAADAASDAPNPAEAAQRGEIRQRVLDAIGSLPDDQRTVTTLFYINGYSHKEIAEFLEAPVSTVKNRLHASRSRLKERMMDMVEDNLKQSRPTEQFAKRVVRRIGLIRLYPKLSRTSGVLVLTDSRKRSFPIFIGLHEAKALQPWLVGKGRDNPRDIYTALVQTLGRLGGRIRDITIAKLEFETFLASVRIRSGAGEAEVDCRPSDAINFAVRAGAPILVDEQVVLRTVLLDAEGKPLPPDEAAQHIRWSGRGLPPSRKQAPFEDFEAVTRALEADPDNADAQTAFCRAFRPDKPWNRYFMRKTAGADRLAEVWVQASKGTPSEGMVAALAGAAFLWLPPEPDRAIPWLETAARLLPDDPRVSFDLASAYVLAGRLDEALDILERQPDPDAPRFVNFKPLWENPGFRRLFGKTKPPAKETFLIKRMSTRFLSTGAPGYGSGARSAAVAKRPPVPGQGPLFPDIDAVLRTLERKPDHPGARQAIREAKLRRNPPLVADLTGAMARVQAWVERLKGTPMAGMAAGLLGAIHLSPRSDPEAAIPWLETAARLRPDDAYIAFDLATAYSMTDRTEQAFEILEKQRFEMAPRCSNFAKLWDTPRFRELFGAPVTERKGTFWIAQFPMSFVGFGPESFVTPVTHPSSIRPVPIAPLSSPRELPSVDESRMREIAGFLGAGALLPVKSIHLQRGADGGKDLARLEVEGSPPVAVPLTELQRGWIEIALADMPRPMTAQAFCRLMEAAGARIEAAALLKRSRLGIEAALVTEVGKDGERRADIPLDGPIALAVALAAPCPLLIAEALHERLSMPAPGKPKPRTDAKSHR